MKELEIIILFIMAFLPPIFYTIWIRNTEKYNREKWKPIFFSFLWGATIAIIASLILELGLGIPIALTNSNYTTYMFIMAVIIAPFVEEITKPIALRFKIVKKELDEPEDGLIYGAVAGLGFAATENLFYGWDAIVTEGLFFFIILISVRSVVGCLLHASATAWTGYGYGKVIMKNSRLIRVLPYFLLAILIHGSYNFIPVYGLITGYGSALFFAMIFIIISIYIVRKKIMTLDQQNH